MEHWQEYIRLNDSNSLLLKDFDTTVPTSKIIVPVCPKILQTENSNSAEDSNRRAEEWINLICWRLQNKQFFTVSKRTVAIFDD
jgi:hypothetical protein